MIRLFNTLMYHTYVAIKDLRIAQKRFQDEMLVI